MTPLQIVQSDENMEIAAFVLRFFLNVLLLFHFDLKNTVLKILTIYQKTSDYQLSHVLCMSCQNWKFIKN